MPTIKSGAVLGTVLTAWFLSFSAHAVLLGSTVSADVGLGIGQTFGTSECKSATVNRIVGPGNEVVGADYTGTACFGYVDVNIGASDVVVTGQREFETGDYRWLSIDLNFTGASPITSVSLVSQNLFQAGFAQPTPTIVFDADSILLTWDTTGSAVFELEQSGTAVFQINQASVVSEPATLALLGLALAGLGFSRRKHTAH